MRDRERDSAPATGAVDLGAAIGSSRWWRGLGYLLSLTALAGAIAFIDASSPPSPPAALIADPQPDVVATTDAPTLGEIVAPIEPALPQPVRAALRLKSGGTLIDLLLDAGADGRDAHGVVTALTQVFNPRKLRAGQQVLAQFQPPAEGLSPIDFVTIDVGFATRVEVARGDDGGFTAQTHAIPVNKSWRVVEGEIDDSLYLAAARAGTPAATIVDLIRTFSFNVDFQRDIWPGDRFSLVYEHLETPEGAEQVGNLLFGELILRGKPIALYRFTPQGDQRTDYFDDQGRSARRLLMRTPIDGARLTSRFGKRKHPILGYTKMHSGIDFGAATGTPIMASGDGTVERASPYGGYGNYVILRHNGMYKTAYAHLSRYGKGIRAGARVKQGQIIGYVGTTGRSTGPHLHYEVLVENRRINPLSLELPTGRELQGQELTAFQARRTQIKLALAKNNQKLVANAATGANP